ncbi:MAG TPA: hypothetical protein VIG34_09085 [Xanthobacteraceae bacterium]
MSSFSIVLDYPWWIAAGFFGAAAATVVYVPPKFLVSRGRKAVAVLFFAAMLWSGAHYFTWSVRLDERGASVQDAAALFQPTGLIRWEDVARIEIGKDSGRPFGYEIRLLSRAGLALEIPLSDIPAEQIRSLARLVASQARRAAFVPSEAEVVSEADRIARETTSALGFVRVRG